MKSKLRITDGFELSFTGLKARPGRTALTALGIAFGIAAIVAVLGISASGREALLQQLDKPRHQPHTGHTGCWCLWQLRWIADRLT